jgi:putative DNA methylase
VVNQHLGTHATTVPDLVEQLGVMRFGHRPTVADTFSGSGQIPFAAAQLGCDVYASDLNPVACMLTWGAFNIVGASPERRKAIEAEQADLVAKVKAEIDHLGIERDGQGWRGKVYLYCLEVTCPSSGWKVPVLPTRIISNQRTGVNNNVGVRLVPDYEGRRYDIAVDVGLAKGELVKYAVGTYKNGDVIHVVDGVEHVNSISSIRGDYTTVMDGKKVKKNRLRQWGKTDIVFSDDDIFNERLYAIQWIKELAPNEAGRAQTEFRSVTRADIERENRVTAYVQAHLAEWQAQGWVPDMRIESGDKTDEPIRTRGWTHWHHLFNPRHLLTFCLLRKHTTSTGCVYLAHALNWNARLCTWNRFSGGGGSLQQVFINQALNTLVDYGSRGFDYLAPLLSDKSKPPVSTTLELKGFFCDPYVFNNGVQNHDRYRATTH